MNLTSSEFQFSTSALDQLYKTHSGIFGNPNQVGQARLISAFNVLSDSTLNKDIQNNTAFMTGIYTTYGFSRFTFYMNNDVLFVCMNQTNSDKQLIIATLSCREYNVGPKERISMRKNLDSNQNDKHVRCSKPNRQRRVVAEFE